jgi:DNA-binding transcriptional ArsR family regulator
MLEYFISSASKRKILIYLIKHPDEEYHLRELSRKIGEPAPVVKRELDKLDQLGLILSWAQGNQRRFRVNRKFLLWPEIKSLVDKSQAHSTPPKVSTTYTLKEIPLKRKSWGKRSRAIVEAYGKDLKRRRPRHPSEAKMLENLP